MPETNIGSETPVFEYKLEFRVTNPDNSALSEAGYAVFTDNILEIKGVSGSLIQVPMRDIQSFEGADYHVHITLMSGTRVDIFSLGYNYQDFLNKLTHCRNNIIKRDLLMHESLLFVAEDIEYVHYDSSGGILSGGPCNAQISDTALILAAPDGYHVKFPLSYVSKVMDDNYMVKVSMEIGEMIHLMMLGRQREPLLVNIEGAIRKLEEKALYHCENLFGLKNCPKELAALFKDGRAVSKKDLDTFSPSLWPEMEARLETCGLAESYGILKAHGVEEESVIGLKRGLMGELTGEYIWFLIPVSNKPVIVMESGSTKGKGGHATYFYKIPPKYNPEGLIRQINYCLLMINFRREPIYLTDQQLLNPAFSEYTYAIERLPALRLLRKLFIGRVIHSSEEKWKNEVEKLISEVRQTDI